MERDEGGGMRHQSFLHGALVLMVSIVLVKILGALFKIPLAWILTTVGSSYFGFAYSIYAPLFSLATAGFPIAISRLVSENYVRGRFRDIRQIHRSSVRIFLVLGIASCSIMILAARPYVNYVESGNPQNFLPAIYALAPAAFFTSMMAIYRGYYEGLRNMYPTAISEVIEALCEVVFGLSAAYLIIQKGMNEYAASGTVFGARVASEQYAKLATLPYAAAGAVFSVTLAGFCAFLFLFLYHKRNGDGITARMLRYSPRPAPARVLTSRLIRTAIPIALGSLAVNLSTLVDSTFLKMRIADIMQTHPQVVLNMYRNDLTQEIIHLKLVPSFLFGCFTNANSLFMVVPAITQAFSTSALPSVTAAWTQGDPKKLRHSIESVLRVVALITIPCGLGLSVMAQPIAALIYPRNNPSIIGRILTVLGLASIFAATSTPINSMLQAVGRVDLPVKLMVVGLVVKVVLNYTLVGIPEINVLGAGTGTLVCYFIITVLALFYLCKITGTRPKFFPIFFKPALAAAVSVSAAWLVFRGSARILHGPAATLVAILAAVVLYTICILWFRALNRHDVLMLPHGQKIVKILEKHHWIR
jgi:stage V sporulation protein B